MSRSRRNHRRRRSSRRKQKLRNRFAVAGAAFLCAGTLFWFIQASQPRLVQPAPDRTEVLAANPIEEPGEVVAESPLHSVLQRHAAVNPFSRAESFAIGSAYKAAGLEYEMDLLVKRPGLYKQVVSRPGIDLSFAFDGKRAWQVNAVVENTKDPGRMSRLNERILLLECSLGALPWQFDRNGSDGLELLPEPQTVAGRSCHVIENANLLSTPVLHFIDAGTGHELRRIAVFRTGEIDYTVVIEYHTPLSGAGDTGAGYRLLINGELMAEAKFHSTRTDVGMMAWIFDPPAQM